MTDDYIKVLSFAYFFASYWVVLHGFIKGTGNTLMPMLTGLAGNMVFRLLLANWLKDLWGPLGIWTSIPGGWAVVSLLTLLYTKSWYFHRQMEERSSSDAAGNSVRRLRGVPRI